MHHCALACFLTILINKRKSAHFSGTLPKENLNSYRPISSLSFISKVLENVVASCLRSHIESNCMPNVLQSAYKQFHFTETALLKVHTDVTLNMDKGIVTVLTLLDLSVASDTIGKLYCFFPTPMLSQNFTLAASAQNLGVTFDNK